MNALTNNHSLPFSLVLELTVLVVDYSSVRRRCVRVTNFLLVAWEVGLYLQLSKSRAVY
jgi:hypothetical protein